jgi:hypothetical protein
MKNQIWFFLATALIIAPVHAQKAPNNAITLTQNAKDICIALIDWQSQLAARAAGWDNMITPPTKGDKWTRQIEYTNEIWKILNSESCRLALGK